MNRIIFFVYLMIGAITINAAIPVNVMELKKIKPAETFYTGEIEALEKGTFSFDIDGKLERLKNTGEYVFERIYDFETDEVVREGTIVAEYDRVRQKFALQEAQMSVRIAEVELEKAIANFERYKVLLTKNAIASKDYLEYSTKYMNAELNFKKAKTKLERAKYDLDSCKIVAPFSGIVSKVLVTEGTHISKGENVIELTKMTPLLVKIPFPEEIVSNFREGEKVKIYPVNGGKPVNAWCRTGLSKPILFAYIENSIVAMGNENNRKKYKSVYEVFPVKYISMSSSILRELGKFKMKYSENEKPLAVPAESILEDEKGYYVLKAVFFEKVDNLFIYSLARVEVEPGGIERDFNLGANRDVKMKSLKKCDGLKTSDFVVLLGEKGLKDGDKVFLENLRWKFAPGQSVKVSIPALHEKGFYVPKNALIHQADNDNYVYLAENGKARLVNVSILGRCSGYNRIGGEELKEGSKIIVFDNDQESDNLYNSANIEVRKTLPPPIRIQHKRADRLIIGLSEIEKAYY